MRASQESDADAGSRAPTDRAAAGPDHQLPPAGAASGSRRTEIGGLLRSLAEDTGTLVRQEMDLAKMEVVHTAKTVAKDSAWIGIGGAIAGVGGLVLVVAMALGLGALLDSYWLGTLITGLFLLLVGALFAWKGIRDLRRQELAPTRTVRSLREDADWARAEAEDFKQGLKE